MQQAAIYKRNKLFEPGEVDAVTPGPGQVRIEIAYCGICGTDIHIFHGNMDARVPNRHIMGHEMSGTLVELGPGVAGWNIGDRVVVRPLASCGECPACKAGHAHICHNLNVLGVDTPGAMQETWTVPADTLHSLPEGISMQRAALVEPIAVAVHDVRLGRIKAGEKVVVIGGGPIGMLEALVSRNEGAEVMISEVNPFRLKMAAEFGFKTINPTESDIIATVNEWTGDAGADAVIETSGSRPGAKDMTELVRTRGRIVMVAIYAQPVEVNLKAFVWRELEMIGGRVYEPEDFDRAIELLQVLPLDQLITTVQPLDQLQNIFEQIDTGADIMKALIELP